MQNSTLTYLYISVSMSAMFEYDLAAAVVHPGPGAVQHGDGQGRVQLVQTTHHRVLGPTETSHQSVEGTFSAEIEKILGVEFL